MRVAVVVAVTALLAAAHQVQELDGGELPTPPTPVAFLNHEPMVTMGTFITRVTQAEEVSLQMKAEEKVKEQGTQDAANSDADAAKIKLRGRRLLGGGESTGNAKTHGTDGQALSCSPTSDATETWLHYYRQCPPHAPRREGRRLLQDNTEDDAPTDTASDNSGPVQWDKSQNTQNGPCAYKMSAKICLAGCDDMDSCCVTEEDAVGASHINVMIDGETQCLASFVHNEGKVSDGSVTSAFIKGTVCKGPVDKAKQCSTMTAVYKCDRMGSQCDRDGPDWELASMSV
jgi:hypothetical protein